jgi:hypothetical protein
MQAMAVSDHGPCRLEIVCYRRLLANFDHVGCPHPGRRPPIPPLQRRIPTSTPLPQRPESAPRTPRRACLNPALMVPTHHCSDIELRLRCAYTRLLRPASVAIGTAQARTRARRVWPNKPMDGKDTPAARAGTHGACWLGDKNEDGR